MKAVKNLFDPKGLLNPGVIFNDDPKCHIKNFKPLPLIPLDAQNPAAKVKPLHRMRLLRSELPVLRLHPLLKTAHRATKGDSPPSTERRSPRTSRPVGKTIPLSRQPDCAGDGLVPCPVLWGINTGDLTHHPPERIAARQHGI